MANIKSQIKRNRQNDKRRLINRVYRGEARIAVKNARNAMDSSAPESREELIKAISKLDKAAEKGVIHKNNAARRKSRLMKAFNGMKPVEIKAPVEEPEPVAEVVEAKPRRSTRAKVEKKAEAPAVVEKTKAKAAPSKTAASKKPAKTAKPTKADKTAKADAAEEPKKTTTRKKAPAKK